MASEVPEQAGQQGWDDDFLTTGKLGRAGKALWLVPLQGAAGGAHQGDGSSEDTAEQGRGSE